MILKTAESEKAAQQGQSVLCQGLVDERMLPLQGIGRATAWLSVVVERRIDDLSKNSSETVRRRAALRRFTRLERLAPDKLAAIGIVPEVEPVQLFPHQVARQRPGESSPVPVV